MSRKKRGSDDTTTALAVGAGLIAVIALYERNRARAAAPVVTKGATGRWTVVGAPLVEYPPLLIEAIRTILTEFEQKANAERAARQKAAP